MQHFLFFRNLVAMVKPTYTPNLNENLYTTIYSLKVPERYEKCLRVSTSEKEKPLPTPLSRRVGNTTDGQHRRGPNESWDKIPLYQVPTTFSEGG